MNMSSLMERLLFTYQIIFFCFTFVCIYGRGQDLFPPCEAGVLVRRGTTWKTSPQQSLTVRCPVQHCGEALNVTWCKMLDANNCEQINYTANAEISRNDTHFKDELISFLTFKRISIHDDGLYRCHLKGHQSEQIGHIINISVSDLNGGFKNLDNNAVADELPSTAGEDMSWLPYLSICVSIALLVTTLIVLTLLRFYGWKRILTFNHKKTQEMSTHMIPSLPQGCAPFTPVLQGHVSILNDIYSPSSAEIGPPQPPATTSGNQPAVANTAGVSQAMDCAVYAVINRRQPGLSAGEQCTPNTEYAAIKAS